MKRSEMVYKIARILYDNDLRCTMMQCLPMAELVLAMMEKEGIVQTKTIDLGDGQLKMIEGWEPENG